MANQSIQQLKDGVRNSNPGRGAGQRRGYKRQSPNKNISIALEATLEDVYNGTTKNVHIDQINKDIQIKIPPGIGQGQSIRYRGLGMSTNKSLPAGDLLCIIKKQTYTVILLSENKLKIRGQLTGYQIFKNRRTNEIFR